MDALLNSVVTILGGTVGYPWAWDSQSVLVYMFMYHALPYILQAAPRFIYACKAAFNVVVRFLASVPMRTWFILAVLAASFTGGAFTVVYFTKPTKPSVTPMPGAATATAIIENLEVICPIHYRMHQRHPENEPETFFQRLGLDPDKEPFDIPDLWLLHGRSRYRLARDNITFAWAEGKNRIFQDVPNYGSEDEKELDLAAYILQDAETASTYVKVVMPKIHHIRGQERLEALMKLCGDHWGEK